MFTALQWKVLTELKSLSSITPWFEQRYSANSGLSQADFAYLKQRHDKSATINSVTELVVNTPLIMSLSKICNIPSAFGIWALAIKFCNVTFYFNFVLNLQRKDAKEENVKGFSRQLSPVKSKIPPRNKKE